MRPATTLAGFTVYGIWALWRNVTVGSQPSRPVLPPMHGTLRLMSCTTPSGVVSLKVPPENAQIVGSTMFAFWSVAR